ncbi:type III secretion system outer membrane ring subunit SctC [Aquabacterium sp. OR-4]|uniref:type III secretion system outer membrane ring subunit SctC n=1 Tax=Aquabacterium sp. OR-4 TaxID=2978127 RepID=UPI0028C96EDB|nr:type III secretion system outer membrane ring subunit SctC [Aquabacterium sp. OR-4]MDT7837975.1 type III secretion system outer membrane ring subunit SctC [Aquabacterium sp. OR-4]
MTPTHRIAAAAWLLLAPACAALAAHLPEGLRPLRLEARDQPLDQFLQGLFSGTDIAVVTTGVQGQVNGRFDGTPTRLLRDLSRAYNLLSYYDGGVLHIAPAADTQTRSFLLAPTAAAQVQRAAQALRLPDARNTLKLGDDGALLAVGARRFVQQIDELVRQVRPGLPGAAASHWQGAQQPLPDYRIFYLRYAWAQDLPMSFGGQQTTLPGVASILRSLVGQPGKSPLAQASDPARAQGSQRGRGTAARGAAAGTLGHADEASTSLRGTEALVAALGEAGQAPALAAIDSQGAAAASPRIEADPRLNAVIVRDLPERLERYAALVKALDIEPQALEIEATIIDINTDRLRELGIHWRYNHGLSSLMMGNGAASDLRLNGLQDVTPSARGGTLSAVIGDRYPFVARISALQSDGAAKVVSSPQVVTLSNVEAVFDNSATYYVRVAGRDEVDLFNVTAGTRLRVTPHVFRDGGASPRIKLLVQIEDGGLSGQSVDQLPIVERSGINTQALITEGESLLIGGMVRDSASAGTDKVPLLGDLPLLGNLFKSQRKGGQRIERLFLITPRLAGSRATADAVERLRQPLVDGAAAPPAATPAASTAANTTAPPVTPPATTPATTPASTPAAPTPAGAAHPQAAPAPGGL